MNYRDLVESIVDRLLEEEDPYKSLYSNAIDNLGKAIKGKNLVLVRGVSGSGKSTFASQVGSTLGHEVYSTDDFFIDNGEYKFDPTKLKDAHKWNQDRTSEALKAEKNVVVPNTFTQKWEIAPYEDIAKQHKASLHVFHTTYPGQNVHGVPQEALERMKSRWEPFEGEIILKRK